MVAGDFSGVNRFEIEITQDLHRAFRQGNKAVMVLGHETLMIQTISPNIAGRKLVLIVHAPQRITSAKAGMTPRLPSPEPAVGDVCGNALLADLEKD
jgi:hypothetical protein